MATARMKHEWNQTADLMALLANVNRGKDMKPFNRSHFHPMEKRKRREGMLLTPEVIRSQRMRFAK